MGNTQIAIFSFIVAFISLAFSVYQFFPNRNQQVETALISIMWDYIKSQNFRATGVLENDQHGLWQWSAGNLLIGHAYGRYHRLVPWWERRWGKNTKVFLGTFRQLLDEDRALMKVAFKTVTGLTPEEAGDAHS